MTAIHDLAISVETRGYLICRFDPYSWLYIVVLYPVGFGEDRE
jgi:hypothetical protein